MHLPGLDDQVDMVVGDQGSEGFGDASEFEFHSPQPFCLWVKRLLSVANSIAIRSLPDANTLPSGLAGAKGRRAAFPQDAAMCRSFSYFFGLALDSTLTAPEMMSFFSWSSSLLVSAETAESRSWNGANATPPLSSVPT